MVLLSFLLFGCLPEQKSQPAYISLDFHKRDRLPLAPHVGTIRARPTAAMASKSAGTYVRFMVLDKRTLRIYRLVASVGKRAPVPWGGTLYPKAFVSDLVIRNGVALHGPEGHFNPVVWVQLEDEMSQPLHEGWMFARDSAQTAWDHPRFDLTFLGMSETPPEGASSKKTAPKETAPEGASPKKGTPPDGRQKPS